MKKFVIIVLAAVINLSVYAQRDARQPFKGVIGKTLADSKQSWPEKIKAADGAPNVVWILIDDVGFGASSTFGGLVATPNFDTLAANGLRYTNFHTTSLCSPTRAALLTGRNAHHVAMGHHPELATGFPGYDGDIPFEAGTAAEIFKENGYNTFALGKWHSTRPEDVSAAGPYNRWPTGRGFEHFFGFMGGATDQWHPLLIDETNPVNIEPNTTHLNKLLADKAIEYIANQKSADADKPFFLYFAPGATHAPHQVAKEWIDKYKGKFDNGWDAYRTKVFKRQQALGLLPAGTVLPPRQLGVKAWDSLSADEKKVYAHFMEVYAAYLSYTDYEVGRVINYLKQTGIIDNTVIFLMIGDNGASKEGTYTGTSGFSTKSQGEDIKFLLSQYDKIGTEFSSPNYPLGWSQAANTPFRYWKSDANSEGGTHNPLIVYYPKGIKEKGGIRFQYGHVIDILPTTIELTGLKVPDTINGYKQDPIQGTSLAYSFNNASAASQHTIQYYELHGGRAVYKDGWKAAVYHPRNTFGEKNGDINFNPRPFSQDKWELYNINKDWTETTDLAAKEPQKLEELKALFDSLAIQNNVYPLKSYTEGLPQPEIKPKRVIYEGTTVRTKINIGKGNVSITANVIAGKDPQGVIFANGGLFGGTSLYIQNGKLIYLLSDGLSETVLSSSKVITEGTYTINVQFIDSTVILSVNGEQQAQATITAKNKYLNTFGSEGVSVGRDLNSPVTKKYPGTFPFNGRVQLLTVEQPSATTKENAIVLPVDSFEAKLNQATAAQIIDTRLPEEFAINHLSNAININSLQSNYAEQLSKLDKTKPVFTYAIGNGRSVQLANELTEKGFTQVYVLDGGIGGWIGNAKPIYSTSKDNFTIADFKKITSTNKLVLLDLHTRYCPGCRKLQPTVDSLSKEYGITLKVVKIDVYDNPAIAGTFKANAVPTLIVYNDDKIIWRRTGADTQKGDVEKIITGLVLK
ncbi:sulfatase-like hydrolase/transferase [Ferruginibacter albus]|uniref:sulfatase-like hydrolase/transferase n=1 Tax=Ferruginibacter albus TaxID=2875540 RepID=UPI001CC617D0|nr:sulfatase-like hydrolase/transferase [Ferruginibacter albus]UAY52037.1 sulfatase-like hydrolase/transferase [Ferruginibacter albus]